MIGNLSDRKFIIYPESVNLRKNFLGLMGLVERDGRSVEFFNNTAIVFQLLNAITGFLLEVKLEAILQQQSYILCILARI